MQGPSLSPREIAVVLTTSVERLERLGIDHGPAVRAVARDNNIDESKVELLLALGRKAA